MNNKKPFKVILLVVLFAVTAMLVANFILIKRQNTPIQLNNPQIDCIHFLSQEDGDNSPPYKKYLLYFVDVSCRGCKTLLQNLEQNIDNLLDTYVVFLITTRGTYDDFYAYHSMHRKLEQRENLYLIIDKEKKYFKSFLVDTYPSIMEINTQEKTMRIIKK